MATRKSPPEKPYKGDKFIAFYDADGEWLQYIFDNAREILKFLGKEVTTNAVNVIDVLLYRALNSDDHKTTMLNGEVMTVFIFDVDGDDDE